MPHNAPPASPWLSEIPVLENRSSASGDYRPYVQLEENLQFDIVCGPQRPHDEYSEHAAFIPSIKENGRNVPSQECVAIRSTDHDPVILDGFGVRAAADFWEANDQMRAKFLDPADVMKDEQARRMGLIALIDVSRTGRDELRLDGYCFTVNTLGIVLATARVLVQRARYALEHEL
jgi:hypothetical protein